MKTYGVGSYRIGVYETRDSSPRDAVAVVADTATIFFVDRIADMSGVIAVGAMTEAVTRHCRLKIAAQGYFELRFDEPFSDDSPGPTSNPAL
jgi:hypothetical protein